MTPPRARRAEQLDRSGRGALIELASILYRTIDRGRLSYADLAGLSRPDLIGLILSAEYPDDAA